MSFLDYVKKGQIVDFELELPDKNPKYMARVEDVSDEVLSISILDDDFMSDVSVHIKGIIQGKKKGLPFNLYVEITKITESSIIQVKHIPARTHLRVDAFILFKYRKISEQEYVKKRKKYTQHTINDSEGYLLSPQKYLSDDAESNANIPSELIGELYSIQRKLDFIIKMIGKSDDMSVFDKAREEINISGAGLKFKSSEIFQTGEFLEIEMVLPISSGIIIEFIGEVVRCSQLQRATDAIAQSLNEIAIKYAAINEDDRESIIRYVFKRQREILRADDFKLD